MKISFKLFLPSLLLLLTSCSEENIVIDDFESGTFNEWKNEGAAFSALPATGTYPNQQTVSGFEGEYLANSYYMGDNLFGTLTSKEFTIERDYINFLLGGGFRDSTYVELIVENKSVFKSRPITESETLRWMSWNLKTYKGKTAIIRVVDNQDGGWGHILIDQIEMSNKKRNIYIPNYTISFRANKKYLLLPMENSAPMLPILIKADNVAIDTSINVPMAQNDIHYWMPIDIEQYNGKLVTLILSNVREEDVGLSQIKQSDRFDFNYNEKYRPSYHFTPQYGWMNNPTGMVYQNGEYHLFYQYNPYGTIWGNMHWGHAVSKNLTRWEHLKVAVAPDAQGAIFSGSSVIDKENLAGFGHNAIIIIYTAAGHTQSQNIAYSIDNGRVFTKYNKNPILSNPAVTDFRDPKVFWHEATQKWIMVLSTSQAVSFYNSANLKEWKKLSEFGEREGAHDGVWECPDLFPLSYNGKTKWILLVSVKSKGANMGGATQYFVGSFDGERFEADSLPYPLWLDHGRDNYAGTAWGNVSNSADAQLFMGWMSNWDYADQVPTFDFRGAATIPRQLKLVHNGEHLIVASSPVKELLDLRNGTVNITDIEVNKSYVIDRLLDNNPGSYEIEMTIESKSASKFSFALTNVRHENLSFIFDLEKERFSIDRMTSGITNFISNFACISEAPLAKRNSYKVRLLIDKASSECFINDGEITSTNLIFPTEPYNSLTFNAQNGKIKIKKITIHKLK